MIACTSRRTFVPSSGDQESVKPIQAIHTVDYSNKLGQRHQVVLPKEIGDELSLQVGDGVEGRQVTGTGVMKPTKLVDADDVLTPEEEAMGR